MTVTAEVEFDHLVEVEFDQVFVIFDEHSTTIFFKMDSTEQSMLSYCVGIVRVRKEDVHCW